MSKALALVVTVSMAWACGYDQPAAVERKLSLVSGGGQRGLAGSELPEAFSVEVTDADDHPVAGVGIMFAVTAGGGHLSVYSAETNALGFAQTTLTLGTDFGTNTVEARAAGVTGSPVAITANATDAPPTQLTYTRNPATYTEREIIGDNLPSNIGGKVVSYSIDPALPDGLVIDPNSGVIAGMPTKPSFASDYTVTATNSGGSTTATISIAVRSAPPSCADPGRTCGPANDSCCASPEVEGGTYARSHDAGTDGAFPDTSFPATISSFRLDRYEVTVGRFRTFVNAGGFTQAGPLVPGSGTHPNLPGSGWQAAFNENLTTGTFALMAGLASCDTRSTWTDAPGSNEQLPINCVTWYEAMEFCAWDGGYLPTEAEWNYAAVGGTEYRAYPWSSPPERGGFGSLSIDCSRANTYSCGNSPRSVGSASPAGDGKWHQADLSGNVWEWTLDWDGPYPTPCDDCANLIAAQYRTMRGAGFNELLNTRLRGSFRYIGDPAARYAPVGFRCARPL